jgi:predicted ATP-dependent endonuclease of OLD family
MVEGSGFLQWLSVYTFAIDPKIDVLFLDEPDAHLHSSLQTDLMKKLQEILEEFSKQILISSHSTEVIKNLSSNIILSKLKSLHKKVEALK